MQSSRIYNCTHCHTLVAICSCCDRGNIYCGDICAAHSRKVSLHLSNKRYQNTYQGKLNHAAAQKRYVARLKRSVQKMTDHGSQPRCNILILLMLIVAARINVAKQNHMDIYCNFCGCRCSYFARNNFLRSNVPRRQ